MLCINLTGCRTIVILQCGWLILIFSGWLKCAHSPLLWLAEVFTPPFWLAGVCKHQCGWLKNLRLLSGWLQYVNTKHQSGWLLENDNSPLIWLADVFTLPFWMAAVCKHHSGWLKYDKSHVIWLAEVFTPPFWLAAVWQ